MIPRTVRSLACATLVAGLALAAPSGAHAQRCCNVRAIPPRLVGVNFSGRNDEVLTRLERAGFGDYDPGNQRIAGLGYLTDTPAPEQPPLEPGAIGGSVLGPSIVCFEMMCGSPGAAMLMPMGGHPNGARMLRTVIAVVADLDRSCAMLEQRGIRLWGTPRFGSAYDDPTLGARVREARYDFGSLRLIAPVDRDGPAARWLAAGGPRWIGFAVEVGDLVATESWLGQNRVRVAREMHDAPFLRIDPADLDGLLVEFVQAGRF